MLNSKTQYIIYGLAIATVCLLMIVSHRAKPDLLMTVSAFERSSSAIRWYEATPQETFRLVQIASILSCFLIPLEWAIPMLFFVLPPTSAGYARVGHNVGSATVLYWIVVVLTVLLVTNIYTHIKEGKRMLFFGS